MKSVAPLPFLRRLPVHAGRAALLLVAVIAAGCAGSRQVATVPPPREKVEASRETEDAPRETVDAPTETVEAPAVVDLLRSEVRTWEGTPHRLGGQNRSGVDCSGFVMRVYDDVFGLSLPRTTEDQAQEGREVSASSLVPGDLVFFRTAPKTRHVGIYLSDGEFAHASSSDGVRVSHLDEPYWRRTYWMSRRVLDGDDVSMTPGARSDEELEEVDSAAESPTRAARTGW